ncbi:MAG: hypothetical protein WCI41_00130 [bacterium]
MQEEREKLNRIEEMKTKLFSKNYEVKIEHHDPFIYKDNKDVPDSWDSEYADESDKNQKNTMKKTMPKKFFIFSILFFILAMGYAAYMFFAGGNIVSNDNIDIAVLGNTFTAGGEELPIQIEITNKNNSLLELADLVVEYPKGSSGDVTGDVERLRDSLGTIPAGAVKSDTMKVILFGEQGSTRQIKVSLEYRVEGSNAIFVKDKTFDVTISSAPIDLAVDAPAEVSPNQQINLDVKATVNATKAASKILVRIDYPVGFQFTSAKPMPSIGNNIWNLGDLSPGSISDIAVTGKMIDVSDGEEKTFNVYSGTQSDSDSTVIGVVFNSLGKTVLVKKPFIEADLIINGVNQNTYATDATTPIQGQIRWANNLDTKVTDFRIVAKLSGNALNRNTISSTDGFYDSSKDSIIWDKNSVQDFNEVNPGDSGIVSFSVTPTSLFSDSGGMLVDPTVNVELTVNGTQAIDNSVLTNTDSRIIKIISDVGLSSKALYYSGAFTNTGPIPPKVEKETTYTINWSLSNTSNSISKAQVRSSLPQWARFVGVISPATEDLKFDPNTKQIIWNVGSIAKGTGITGADNQVSFQIAITPSLSQVGSAPIILNDTVLTGHDDFANVDVQVNKSSLNTRLSSDADFPGGGDRVVN